MLDTFTGAGIDLWLCCWESVFVLTAAALIKQTGLERGRGTGPAHSATLSDMKRFANKVCNRL